MFRALSSRVHQVPWGISQALLLFLASWLVLPIVVELLLLGIQPIVPAVHVLLTDNVWSDFAFGLFDAATGAALLYIFLRRYHVPLSTLGWRRVKLAPAVGYLLACFTGFAVIIYFSLPLLHLLLPGFNAQEPQNTPLIDSAKTYPMLALVALVVIPPIIEESIFRGFIFPAFSKRFGFWGGAIISSALFGVAHMQANVGIYTFFLGMILCFMYARLRSIVPGVLLHMVNNLLVFVAIAGS